MVSGGHGEHSMSLELSDREDIDGTGESGWLYSQTSVTSSWSWQDIFRSKISSNIQTCTKKIQHFDIGSKNRKGIENCDIK